VVCPEARRGKLVITDTAYDARPHDQFALPRRLTIRGGKEDVAKRLETATLGGRPGRSAPVNTACATGHLAPALLGRPLPTSFARHAASCRCRWKACGATARGHRVRSPRHPLDRHPTWKHVACPQCAGPARRETDTMDTFVDSSWYFARFTDPWNADAPTTRAVADRMMPVDQYIGGVEHAILHLLYSRFFTRP